MMSLLNNIELIFAGQTEHQEVSISEGRDHYVSTLTSYSHGMKGLVRFDCVVAGLHGFVPKLQGMLHAARQELLLIQVPDAGDQIFVNG